MSGDEKNLPSLHEMQALLLVDDYIQLRESQTQRHTVDERSFYLNQLERVSSVLKDDPQCVRIQENVAPLSKKEEEEEEDKNKKEA